MKKVGLICLAGAAQVQSVHIQIESGAQCAAENVSGFKVLEHPDGGIQDFMNYKVDAEWKRGVYYVDRDNDENDEFIQRGPDYAPKKQEGKKRIIIMGDSQADDDSKWGWTPHLANQIAKDNLPFELLNFARGGATIAQPAISDQSQGSCHMILVNKKSNVYLPAKWKYDSDTTSRFRNAKASNPDIAIIQIGSNDVLPMCLTDSCQCSNKQHVDVNGICPKGTNAPSIAECFHQGTSEDEQFKKIKEGLKTLIQDTKAFESKPEIVLISAVPWLDCCPHGDTTKDSFPIETRAQMKRYFGEKMPQIYAEVAKETNVKYINLYEVYKGKSEQEMCDMQKLVSGPGWCNSVHYGRVEIMQQLNEVLIKPELEKIKQVNLLAAKIQANSESKIVQAAVQPQSSAFNFLFPFQI